jgi:hypothetical protein
MENDNSSENIKKATAPSSLKNNKFEGLTAEQIIKKYENVLFSREKQFFELSQEIGKLTQKVQNLVQRKEKSKYNNDILKDIYSKNEQRLKQELTNKEIVFMKLTLIEHKHDDLQNKIDDIIFKQNALADSTQKEKERMNQDKEEGKKLIDKDIFNVIKEENKINNTEKEIDNEIKEEIITEDLKKDDKKENQNKNDEITSEENNKKNDKENTKKIENIKVNKEKSDVNVPEKNENSFNLARERLNKLKKEKGERIKKLNLSELFASQTNSENDNKNNNE